MATEPTLTELRKQIEDLKKEKKEKLAFAKSTQERDLLLREINQLDAIKKSPSALKSFGKTFSKGLKMTGKALWGGLSRASRNLDRNAPEYGKFAGSMFSAQGSPTQSTQSVNSISSQEVNRISSPKVMQRPRMKPKKKPKKKKGKSKKVKARRKVIKTKSKPKPKQLWEMP